MLNSEKKITIEMVKEKADAKCSNVVSPFNSELTKNDKLLMMISRIIEEEIPQLKNNSLLFDLVSYSILEKMNTVQNVENVLSYMKVSGVKSVQDVSFKNGEVCIKCLI